MLTPFWQDVLGNVLAGIAVAGVLGLIGWLFASYRQFKSIATSVGSLNSQFADFTGEFRREQQRGDDQDKRLNLHDQRIAAAESQIDVHSRTFAENGFALVKPNP